MELNKVPSIEPTIEDKNNPTWVGISSKNKQLEEYEVAYKPLAGGNIIFKARKIGQQKGDEANRVLKIEQNPCSTNKKSRLEYEAEALQASNSRHTPVVYTVGRGKLNLPDRTPATIRQLDLDERPMVLMEGIEGDSIRQMFIEGKEDEIFHRATEILLVTAEVIDSLAKTGIRHRDISTGNILIGREVKIIDFDISTSVIKGMGDDLQINYDGNYMPPEIGHLSNESIATDTFELAVLAYSLLSGGDMPYGNKLIMDQYGNYRQFSIPRLWKNGGLQNTPYESLNNNSYACVRYTKNQLTELDNIFKKALSMDQQNRYQSALNLVSDIISIIQQPSKTPTPLRRDYFPSNLSLFNRLQHPFRLP